MPGAMFIPHDANTDNTALAVFIVSCLFFAIMGIALLILLFRIWWGARLARGWPTTTGRVTESQAVLLGITARLHPFWRFVRLALALVPSDGTMVGPYYEPCVTYTYTVSGRAYTGRRIRLGPVNSGKREAQSRAADYPVGSTPQVRYDPQRPERAVLESEYEVLRFWVLLTFALVFLIGVGVFVVRDRGNGSYAAHRAAVASVAISSDNTLVASAGSDALRVWDVATGEQRWLHEPSTHTQTSDRTRVFAFSPDGTMLASSEDKALVISDAATGVRRATLPSFCVGATFAADGRSLLCAGQHDATIWDLASGTAARTFPIVDPQAPAPKTNETDYARTTAVAAFSPDRRYLATEDNANTILLWEVATGRELRAIANKQDVRTLAFSSDGTLLAGSTSPLTLWEVATGRVRPTPKSVYTIGDFAFGPDGTVLTQSGTYDTGGGVNVISLATGASVQGCGRQEGGIYMLAVSPDGTLLATGGFDRSMRLCTLATRTDRLEFHRHFYTR